MNRHRTGMLIVFEGLDGAGKTTCAKAVAEAIGAHYMTTPAPALRAIQATILDSLGDCQEARQLFYLSTVFAAAKRVREALAEGRSVVMDRYFLSTQIYAQVRGSHCDLDPLGDLLPPATVTIFLDAPVAVRRTRLRGRHCTRADRETLAPDIDARLRSLYLEKARMNVAGKFVIVDSSGTADQLSAQAMREIDRLREVKP